MNREEAFKFHGAKARGDDYLAAMDLGRRQESHALSRGGKSDLLPARH